MQPKIIAGWNEVSEGFLTDGPPKIRRYEAFMFVNHCEVRETPTGKRYMVRSLDVEKITAGTQEDLESKVSELVLRDDMRLLVTGLETNDFDILPRRSERVSADLLAGTADIYQDKNAVGV